MKYKKENYNKILHTHLFGHFSILPDTHRDLARPLYLFHHEDHFSNDQHNVHRLDKCDYPHLLVYPLPSHHHKSPLSHIDNTF